MRNTDDCFDDAHLLFEQNPQIKNEVKDEIKQVFGVLLNFKNWANIREYGVFSKFCSFIFDIKTDNDFQLLDTKIIGKEFYFYKGMVHSITVNVIDFAEKYRDLIKQYTYPDDAIPNDD